MEEVYTCHCKNQSFVLYADRIECTKCKNKYHLVNMVAPKYFNVRAKDDLLMARNDTEG